jgi:CDP-6-deoxy-D-xylo-4-hexulose-3-dehydrase
VRQPAYLDIERRIVGDLAASDFVMDNVFWIGVFPGIKADMRDYMLETLHRIARR